MEKLLELVTSSNQFEANRNRLVKLNLSKEE